MNGLQVRLLNRGQARVTILGDNVTDFPPTSPGGIVRAQMEVVITDILAMAAVQSSGVVSQRVEIKDENFIKLKKLMRQFNRAGQSLSEEIEGIEELFRLPYGEAEEIWLAKGRAFYANSEAYRDAMQDYMPTTTFREDLIGYVTSIEANSGGIDSARAERGGATGALEAKFRELGRLGRKANNIVLNKYEDDPEKLAAWLIASHLRAASKRKDEGEGEGEGNTN